MNFLQVLLRLEKNHYRRPKENLKRKRDILGESGNPLALIRQTQVAVTIIVTLS